MALFVRLLCYWSVEIDAANPAAAASILSPDAAFTQSATAATAAANGLQARKV